MASLEQPKFISRSTPSQDNNTRNVLIVGMSGSGISTLANHILGVGRHVFSVGEVTKDSSKLCTKFEHDLQPYYVNVINTIGFYGELPSEDVIKSIKRVVKDNFDGLHLIIFVMREGKPAATNGKTIYDVYKKFGSNADCISLLVLTGCEDKDKDKVVMKYAKEPIAEHMKKGILAVGFPDFHDYLTLSEVREDEMSLRDVICSQATGKYMLPKSKLFQSDDYCVVQ